MQLYFVSRDGQARRIAARIAERLTEAGFATTSRDLVTEFPQRQEIESNAGPIVVVAAVRYGKHLQQADRLAALYASLTNPPPLIFFSVNLTARKPEKRTAEGSTYLRKLIAKYALKPVLARAIAGRLDYPSYRFFDRQMIRFIMFLTGGPTDTSATIEFTDWQEIDMLATRIGEIAAQN